MITVKTRQVSTTAWEIIRNGANGRSAYVTLEPTTGTYTLHDHRTDTKHDFDTLRAARKFFLNY